MTILPEAKLYIDGEIRGAEGGKTYDVLGPWTGDVVTKAADASAADVEAAIAAARRGLVVELRGSGQVIAQTPEPGAEIEPGLTCLLTLGREPRS